MEYKLKDKTNKDCPKCNSKLYNDKNKTKFKLSYLKED
jgi:hypothetical protein